MPVSSGLFRVHTDLFQTKSLGDEKVAKQNLSAYLGETVQAFHDMTPRIATEPQSQKYVI